MAVQSTPPATQTNHEQLEGREVSHSNHRTDPAGQSPGAGRSP